MKKIAAVALFLVLAIYGAFFFVFRSIQRQLAPVSSTFDGKKVNRVRHYWGRKGWYPFPVTKGLMEEYWFYSDDKGQEIKHGPYRSFYYEGTPNVSSVYRDGQVDGIERLWNENGYLHYEFYYDQGRYTGKAEFAGGQKIYASMDVVENGKIYHKVFEKGVWLTFVRCSPDSGKYVVDYHNYTCD